MSAAWQTLPERSNRFWLRAITWVALRLGRPVARVLLYPITAYFMVFRNRTRPASQRYLRAALGREPRWIDGFRQQHTFACTLLDRIYLLANRERCLTIRVHGQEALERHVASGTGCLLVGAHLGSFEIIRAAGRNRRGLRVKAMMYGEGTPQIARLYRTLNPALHEDLIAMGEPGALLGLDQFIAAGGLLALLGDRCASRDKRVQCPFFGEAAWFPQAPVVLSQILHAPLLLFICLNTGWGRYEVYFEALADYQPVPRREREALARQVMQRYAQRLEHYCRAAPYNWFNFHDIWQTDA